MGKGKWPLPGLWSFIQEDAFPPGTHPDARHFSSPPYATGALPAAALVPESRRSESVQVLIHWGSFKRRCLRILQLLPLSLPPLAFTARNYGDLSSWHWNPGLGFLVWGWNPLLLRNSFRFLSTAQGCGATCFTCAGLCISPSPLLPIRMNVTSLIPWWSDFHTVQFSDNSGCCCFVI